MELNPNTLGLQFISALISEGTIKSYLHMGSSLYLFEYAQAERVLYDQFEQFVKKYGKLPAKETFEQEFGQPLPDVTETAEFYRDKLLDRHLHRSMVLTSEKASELLIKKDAKGAFALLKEMVNQSQVDAIKPSLHDFRNSHDIVMQSIASKFSSMDKEGLEFGWQTFDEMSGGLRGGDLISFCGRPAVGKSYFSLYSALNAWEKQKKIILFISMEMNPIAIFERLSSMYTHVPAHWLKTGGFPTLHTNEKLKFSKTLKKLEAAENPFHVVDGNLTASVADIAVLCHQLKPDGVFVDGAYLLGVPGYHGSKYEKIGEIAKELKHLSIHCNVPVIASWQFNRESAKTKKTEKVGLEHIAGSDEIGQLSSVVLGLFEEENISTAQKRKITILKGREGESGEILVNWNFQKMDFSETTPNDDFEVI